MFNFDFLGLRKKSIGRWYALSWRSCSVQCHHSPSGTGCKDRWYNRVPWDDWIFRNNPQLHTNVSRKISRQNSDFLFIISSIYSNNDRKKKKEKSREIPLIFRNNCYKHFSHSRAVLERLQIESASWGVAAPVLISALIFYCITQFVFFSLVPVILFESGATALQLALLTADFFNVLIGMLTHQYRVRK